MPARQQHPPLEHVLETVLFKARWLMAPFYFGLVLTLILLLATFIYQLYLYIVAFDLNPEAVILAALTLIDLSLAGNLVIIVIFSGYENFVSKIDTGDSIDRPSWMGTLDFSGLKMKLIGSIVAISSISLLRAFMATSHPGSKIDNTMLFWLVTLHMTFLASGVLFALMDWIASKTGSEHKKHGRATSYLPPGPT